MIPRLLENLIGANWRTTLSGLGTALMGLLTGLASAPAELGSISTVFPPEWKPLVFKVCGAAAFVLFIIKSLCGKDAVVAGNGSGFKPNTVNDGSMTGHTVPLVALLLLPAFLLTACLSTDTGNLTHDRRNAVANVLLQKAARVLGQVAVSTLTAAASQEMSGGKVDWQHDAAQAAWTQAPSIVTSDDLERILAAATLNHTPLTVAAAGQQLQAAQAAGIATKNAVDAIASTISGTALIAP